MTHDEWVEKIKNMIKDVELEETILDRISFKGYIIIQQLKKLLEDE